MLELVQNGEFIAGMFAGAFCFWIGCVAAR
jgi:tRNA G37 N-methylase Trm5